MKKFILPWIVITIMFYLTAVFIESTFIPSQMNKDVRTGVGCFWAIIMLIASMAIVMHEETKDQK